MSAVRQHKLAPKQVNQLLANRRILDYSFHDIYDEWRSKNTKYKRYSQAYNSRLKKEQNGSIAGSLRGNDGLCMWGILHILGKDMEDYRQGNELHQKKYLTLMRRGNKFLEARVNRPSLLAIMNEHSPAMIEGEDTISEILGRLEAAKLIKRKHTSRTKIVTKNEDGSVNISYQMVENGRGDIILEVSKFTIAWNVAFLENTELADNQFFKNTKKENSYQTIECKQNIPNNLSDITCGQVQGFKAAYPSGKLRNRTNPIGFEEKNQIINPSKTYEAPVANPKEFKGGGGGEPKTGKIRPISEAGALYEQKMEADRRIGKAFPKSEKAQLATKLWLMVCHLIYPDKPSAYKRSVEKPCIVLLQQIMDRTGVKDSLTAFHIVSMAIEKVHKHLLRHPDKRKNLYFSMKAYLDPYYKGGLMQATEDWVMKGYFKNMAEGKKRSELRHKCILAHRYGEKLWRKVVATHAKTHHGANALFHDAKNKFDNYFSNLNKGVPVNTQKKVIAAFTDKCSSLLVESQRYALEERDTTMEAIRAYAEATKVEFNNRDKKYTRHSKNN